MKRLLTGLISGIFFTGLFVGTAIASGDEHYEYGEGYEHGRYYNPYANAPVAGAYYGNGYYNNGYRNHEAYEYNDDYRYRGNIRNGYVNPSYNSGYYGNGYYNNGYRNHEAYEYGR